MGYELYRHVLNNAPAEIDAAARLVLAVIADDANEKTRRSYLGMDLLSHRTGLLPDSASKALRRLAKAGFEIRVPVGTDKNGKPVFAMKGHRTVYLIPVFPERFMAPKPGREADLQGEESPDERQAKDGSKAGSSSAKAGRESAKPGREADPLPQSPQSPHSFGPEDGSLFPVPEETNTHKDEMNKPAKKKTTAPEHLDITDQMRAWADQNTPGINLELETLKFLNHHGAKGSKFIDWVKAWRNWMINARQFAEERQQNRRGNLRVVGGSRNDVPDNSYWDNVTDEDLKRSFL
ncbi:hypothetical protein [Nocardiopsis alba]